MGYYSPALAGLPVCCCLRVQPVVSLTLTSPAPSSCRRALCSPTTPPRRRPRPRPPLLARRACPAPAHPVHPVVPPSPRQRSSTTTTRHDPTRQPPAVPSTHAPRLPHRDPPSHTLAPVGVMVCTSSTSRRTCKPYLPGQPAQLCLPCRPSLPAPARCMALRCAALHCTARRLHCTSPLHISTARHAAATGLPRSSRLVAPPNTPMQPCTAARHPRAC